MFFHTRADRLFALFLTFSMRYTLKENPAFFGAYLNMARHNAFITLNAIARKLEMKEIEDDEKFLSSPALKAITSKQENVSSRAVKLFEHHLPFLKPMIESEIAHKTVQNGLQSYTPLPEDYNKIISSLFELLNQLRNAYTHYDPDELARLSVDNLTFIWLQKTFDAALRSVRERQGYGDAEVGHLVRIGRNKQEKPDFVYALRDKQNPQMFSEKGLAFFTSLFLDTAYAFNFLKKLGGFKGAKEVYEKATLLTYTRYKIIIPRPKLASTNTPMALLLDMVNELARCPKPLYDLLTPEDRKRFDAKADDDLEPNGEEEEDIVIQSFGLKRKESRFTYFALCFLEENIPSLNWQIDLGDYYHKVYPKETLGQTVQRRLRQRLFAFGKLSNFTRENRPESWKPLLKTTDPEDLSMHNRPEPFITDTTPHYHILDNNVCIGLIHQDWPKLDAPKSAPHIETLAYLSAYELPAMVFWVFLLHKSHNNGNKGNEIRAHLTQVKDKCLRFLKDISKGKFPALPSANSAEELETYLTKTYGLHLWQIPERIKDRLMHKNTADHHTKAQKLLDFWREDSRMRLEKIGKAVANKPKIGKRGEGYVKAGRLADFLAEDLMRFQPTIGETPQERGKDKANDSQYRILQQRLAFFGKEKSLLSDTFRELNLIGAPNAHPFLHRINLNDCSGILAFYTAYLKERAAYLAMCADRKDWDNYHFLRLRPDLQDETELRQLATELLKMPINLPRGLFLDPILALLSQEKGDFGDWLAQAKAQQQRMNVAFLIQQYFRLQLNDDTQPFYEWKRNYEFIDRLLDNRRKQRQTLEKKYHLPERIAEKAKEWFKELAEREQKDPQAKSLRPQARLFKESEDRIRLLRTEDRLMFLMAALNLAKYQNRDVMAVLATYNLKDIRPQNEDGKSLWEQKVEYTQPIKFTIKDGGDCDGERTIIQPNLKMKNFGDFRRMLYDRRLRSLLPYFPATTPISRERIHQELEAYEKLRIAVFLQVYAFEKQYIGMYANEMQYSSQPSGKMNDSKHGTLLSYLSQIQPEIFTPQLIERMKALRNGFSHNQFPKYDSFRNEIDPSKPIAAQFETILENTYGQFLK